jgi:hypothetical protein
MVRVSEAIDEAIKQAKREGLTLDEVRGQLAPHKAKYQTAVMKAKRISGKKRIILPGEDDGKV